MQKPDDFAVSSNQSLAESRLLTLKHDDTFGVFDRLGDIPGAPGRTEGLYHCDTRYLSRYELSLDFASPMLLSATLRDDNGTLTADLTNPDTAGAADQNLIHVRRSRFIWNRLCCERLLVRNFGIAARTVTLGLRFGADFVDLFEVRGTPRARHGRHDPPSVGPDSVALRYLGLDGISRETRLRFQPTPDGLTADDARFTLTLPPGSRQVIHVEIACDPPAGATLPPVGETFVRSLLDARRTTRRRSASAAAIETSNAIFNEAMRRAISDLTMLVSDTGCGPYPYAGIPWFSTEFGRDALITALQVLWMDPAIARGVLRFLAANQATAEDPASDAEPGKILHEVRHGEMARLGEVPFRRYYGSVDSTPLFLMLAGAYLDRTGDLATLRAVWPQILAALGWIESHADGDGFVSYFRKTPQGLANQGWKDSFDSISHADGTLAEGPIALVEVQGYVYAARGAVARIARQLGDPAIAERERARAETLRENFERAFWCENLGTYALALDGAKKPCAVRASNAGQMLMTGIAAPERAARVVQGLMGATAYTGWGIRTLASTEARYNPMSYHNGSVWPHDNALIATGFARYGFKTEAARILSGLFDASLYIDHRRLPELFCGFARRRGQGPVSYPVACSPQAWAATAMHACLAACLGLSFDPDGDSVVFNTPILPPSLEEVKLHNLRLKNARISVLLRRAGGEVAMHVLSRDGQIQAVLRS